jgi:hypothetical protein
MATVSGGGLPIPGATSPPAAAAIVGATAPVVEPLGSGRQLALVTPARAYGFEFSAAAAGAATTIDVGVGQLPLGTVLEFEIVVGLSRWSGVGSPAFVAAPAGVAVNLQVSGTSLRVAADTTVAGAPRRFDPSGCDGRCRRRRALRSANRGDDRPGGSGDSFATVGGPAGIYACTVMWSVADGGPGPQVRDPAPVSLLFAVGPVPSGAMAGAVAWLGAPANRPVAIVAATARTVVPAPVRGVRTPTPTIEIVTQWSDPVMATNAGPQVPVLFDGRQRFAALAAGSPRVGTDVLSFRIVPTVAEHAAATTRLGPALQLSPGAGLRGAAGGPAVFSLPPGMFVEPPAPVVPVVITADLVRDTVWRAGRTYVVDGEVHVRRGVTLTIEDGVTVLIRNGRKPRRMIDTSALVFDSGSTLRAGTVTFAAADDRRRCPGDRRRHVHGDRGLRQDPRHQPRWGRDHRFDVHRRQ